MRRVKDIAVRSLLVLGLAACGNGDHDHDHDHSDHDHAKDKHEHKHTHTHADDAKYGGHMVEIGAHAAWVEIVHSPVSGMIEAYVYDAHVENPLPNAMKHLPLVVHAGGKKHALKLLPHINPVTTEKEGAVSEFRAEVAELKGVNGFQGVLGPLELRGNRFPAVTFTYPAK